jgi:hypothetical protein
MLRVLFQLALTVGGAIALAGCGLADSRSPVPEFLRNKPAEPPPPEAPPDVKLLLREKLDTVFTAASNPRGVRVSPPLREARGAGWTACVRAELTSVIGKPLGAETYRITISGGMITDRRRDDDCALETYEPI